MEEGNKICFRVGLKVRKGRRSGCVKGEGRGTERGRSEELKEGGLRKEKEGEEGKFWGDFPSTTKAPISPI